MLPGEIWENRVLPNMGRRLGMSRHTFMREYPQIEPVIRPDSQLISQAEWNMIVSYYLVESPDSLLVEIPEYPVLSAWNFETAEPLNSANLSSVISYLGVDSLTQTLIVGDALTNRLHFLNPDFTPQKNIEFTSPVVDIDRNANGIFATLIGIMAPNDEREGQIVKINRQQTGYKVLIDSLRRPVHTRIHDFDRDGSSDYLVCEYGNNLGQLSIHYGSTDGSFTKKTVIAKSGAVKTILTNYDGEGGIDMLVLFAQGDERIDLFLNRGDRHYERRTLLRFPPQYGSYDLQFTDIDEDGRNELLYMNGDNGDYSNILKPYHGFRIFDRDGSGEYVQRFFFPMHGASTMELADIDRDGDRDIALTSTFPGEGEKAGPGVIILENQRMGKELDFKPYQVDRSLGRPWTLVESFDADRDGDLDLVAASMHMLSYVYFKRGITSQVDTTSSLLLLENLRRNQ
ncbi:MAG: VCBS repeat-containing protein [Balneolaceae bacterium]|nr:VCBS repeat-containing protein [Balneolaceae bacterium]